MFRSCHIRKKHVDFLALLVTLLLTFFLSLLATTVPLNDAREQFETTLTFAYPTQNINTTDRAYVLVFTNDRDEKGVIALEGAFRDVDTRYNRIALCTPSVSKLTRQLLKLLNIRVIEINQTWHNNFRPKDYHGQLMLSKLEVFRLDRLGYKRIIYIDADTIIMRNIDDLMDRPEPFLAMAGPDKCHVTPFKMCSGLMVITPDSRNYVGLMNQLRRKTNLGGERDVIQSYFRSLKRLRTLPESDVSFVWRCECILKGLIPYFELENVRVVHFTSWWIVYEDVIADLENRATWPEPCGLRWYERWLSMYNTGLALLPPMPIESLEHQYYEDVSPRVPDQLKSDAFPLDFNVFDQSIPLDAPLPSPTSLDTPPVDKRSSDQSVLLDVSSPSTANEKTSLFSLNSQ